MYIYIYICIYIYIYTYIRILITLHPSHCGELTSLCAPAPLAQGALGEREKTARSGVHRGGFSKGGFSNLCVSLVQL